MGQPGPGQTPELPLSYHPIEMPINCDYMVLVDSICQVGSISQPGLGFNPDQSVSYNQNLKIMFLKSSLVWSE